MSVTIHLLEIVSNQLEPVSNKFGCVGCSLESLHPLAMDGEKQQAACP